MLENEYKLCNFKWFFSCFFCQSLTVSFLFKFIFNWRLIALPYRIVFCCTIIWISHKCIYISPTSWACLPIISYLFSVLYHCMKESESVSHSAVSDSFATYSPPSSSVHAILHARLLEWVAIPFSRRSSPPGDQTQVSCTAGRFSTIWATRETPYHCIVLAETNVNATALRIDYLCSFIVDQTSLMR